MQEQPQTVRIGLLNSIPYMAWSGGQSVFKAHGAKLTSWFSKPLAFSVALCAQMPICFSREPRSQMKINPQSPTDPSLLLDLPQRISIQALTPNPFSSTDMLVAKLTVVIGAVSLHVDSAHSVTKFKTLIILTVRCLASAPACCFQQRVIRNPWCFI